MNQTFISKKHFIFVQDQKVTITVIITPNLEFRKKKENGDEQTV